MVKKVSKEKMEISKTLNQIFSTRIRWEKLSLNELNEFINALLSRKFCSKICGKSIIKDMLELIDKVIPEDQQGPILRSLKKLLAS